MARYHKRYHKEKGPDFVTIIAMVLIFVVGTAVLVIAYFFAHCVFKLRFDVRACFHEQVAPAEQKAAGWAAQLL